MDGIPPALPTDSEDVVWALQTADSLWKRNERSDAVVWLRRAAQAAGDSDDAKRAATLARRAAELTDAIKRAKAGAPAKTPAKKKPIGLRTQSLEELDRMFGDPSIAKAPPKPKPAPAPVRPKAESSGSIDVEIVSASDFEAGFKAPSKPSPRHPSEAGEVMTISEHAPDVEILEEEEGEAPPSSGAGAGGDRATDVEEHFPEEEPTPVRMAHKSPAPPKSPSDVPSAAQAHAGMLDPWGDEGRASRISVPGAPTTRRSAFEEEEVVTSAKRPAQNPPTAAGPSAQVPPAPKAPRIGGPTPPPPSRRPVVRDEPPPEEEDVETTTYRQVNPRSGGKARRPMRSEPDVEIPISSTQMEVLSETKPEPKAPPKPAPKPPRPPPPVTAKPAPPKPPSEPPAMDLLEMVDSVSAPEPEPARTPPPPTPAPPSPPPPPPGLDLEPESRGGSALTTPVPAADLDVTPTPIAPSVSFAPTSPPRPSAVPTPQPPNALLPVSARPTAPPPSSTSVPVDASPSSPPTKPRAGSTLLDLAGVEALSDLPDDAREAFAASATIHAVSIEEEVSDFALALVVDGAIDVSSTIVDAPALKLEKNAILRSRGTLDKGVGLRLVCSTPKARIATWDDAAVADAFRTCPWVEDDLRAVADRVQAKVGMTMGPLGERWDLTLREHLISMVTLRTLSPGEVLVAQGKPVPLAIVGVGELVVSKAGAADRSTLRSGDFVFPQNVLAHGSAPATVAAGAGGAIVFYGDRAVAQELLMSFPPILEVLATI